MRWPRVQSRLFGRWLAITGVVLATAPLVAGAPPAGERASGAVPRPRTDFYGDPLPPGAVARLGTLRDNVGFIASEVVL